MEAFYLVKVKVEFETDNGKVKTGVESYLVSAISVTDAEAKTTKEFETYPHEWEVKSAASTRIVKVIE